MKRCLIVLVAALAVVSAAAHGAETEQKYGFSPESFEIKYYVQPRYSVDLDTDKAVDNGFAVRRSRVYLTSTVAPRLKGRIQLETRPQGVETREVWFEYAGQGGLEGISGRVGQFKKPFSYQEFEMSSGGLNLIDRPKSNEFLESALKAAAYDQGAMIQADLWERDVPAMISAGVFNGNGINRKSDDNSAKEFVVRADVTPSTGVSLGGNVALNGVGTGEASESFLVWGGDLRLEKRGVQFVGEIFGGDNYEARLASATADVPSFLGVYGEAIYRSRGWEPAARLERFDSDTDTSGNALTIITGQIARSFSGNFRWQINVVHTRPEFEGADSETQVVSQWTVRL